MTEVFKLLGTIAIDASGVGTTLNETSSKAENFVNGLGRKFKRLAGIIGSALAVDKLKNFSMACANTYATIAAEQSAFEQIMGDYSESAQQKLDAVADKTGVVSSRLTPYMTSMTAKFKGLGYGVDEATTLAMEGLELASDAAAFWDKSLDDSMGHLNSFINGNYEGGEAIGLFARDTQMAAYAVEKGLIAETKAWAQLDEATKQTLRLQYAKETFADAGITGQAARESDNYANAVANLKEQWRQLQGIMGKPILEKIVLPVIKKLTQYMPKITNWVSKLTDRFSLGLSKIKPYVKEIFTEDGIDFEAFGKSIVKMFRDLSGKIPNLLTRIGSAISSVWGGTVWPLLQGLFKATFDIELPDWTVIATTIENGWETYVKPAIETVIIWFRENTESVLAILKSIGIVMGTLWVVSHPLKALLVALGGAFALLNTDVDPANTTLTNVKSALVDIKKWIDENSGAVKAAIGAAAVALAMLNWPLALIVGLLAIVIANWEGLKTVIGKVTTAINEFFSITLPGWWEDSIVTPIKNAWKSVTDAVNAAIDAVKTFLGLGDTPTGFDRTVVEAERGLGINKGSSVENNKGHGAGSFAKGLDYVPYDDFPAYLHKGEAVLTATEAAVWRNGGGMGSADVGRLEAAINGLYGLLSQISTNTASGHTIQLDSGLLVGELLPAMDAGLGTVAIRKGRRNG